MPRNVAVQCGKHLSLQFLVFHCAEVPRETSRLGMENLGASQLCMMSGCEAFWMRMLFHCSIYFTVRTKGKNKSSQGKVEIPWLTIFHWLSSQTLISAPWLTLIGIKCFIFKIFSFRTLQTLRILHLKLNLSLHFKRPSIIRIGYNLRWICFPLFSSFFFPRVYFPKCSIRQCLIFDIEILKYVSLKSPVLSSTIFGGYLLAPLNLMIWKSCSKGWALGRNFEGENVVKEP